MLHDWRRFLIGCRKTVDFSLSGRRDHILVDNDQRMDGSRNARQGMIESCRIVFVGDLATRCRVT